MKVQCVLYDSGFDLPEKVRERQLPWLSFTSPEEDVSRKLDCMCRAVVRELKVSPRSREYLVILLEKEFRTNLDEVIRVFEILEGRGFVVR